MRFVDFLKATVLLCAGAATLLAALTIVGGARTGEQANTLIAVVLVGDRGRHRRVDRPPPRRLAADRAPARRREAAERRCPSRGPGSRSSTGCGRCSSSRSSAAALSFFLPQVAGVAAGFAIIWSLAWRRQDAAVTAIEERDGFRFYVDRTGAFSPIRLIRTPRPRRRVAL